MAQGRKILRRNGYRSDLGLKRRGQRVRTMPTLDTKRSSPKGRSCGQQSLQHYVTSDTLIAWPQIGEGRETRRASTR